MSVVNPSQMPKGSRPLFPFGSRKRKSRWYREKNPPWFDAEEPEWFEDAVDNPAARFPECRHCKEDLQVLESTNPPIQWYQGKFCDCRGDTGLICGSCIRKEIKQSPERCTVCRAPWKAGTYRLVRAPISPAELRQKLQTVVFSIAFISFVAIFFWLVFNFVFPWFSLKFHQTHQHYGVLGIVFWDFVLVVELLVAMMLMWSLSYMAFVIFIVTAVEYSYPLIHRWFGGLFPRHRVTGVKILAEPSRK